MIGRPPISPLFPSTPLFRSQIDFGSFFDNYLDPGFKSPATEDIEKPSFENFLAQPSSLTDHLELQLRLSTCSEAVRAAAFSIVDRKSTRLNSSHLVISYAVF